MSARSVLLVGASGLVGGHCLGRLMRCGEYERITILVRKKISGIDSKIDQLEVDFDRLSALQPAATFNDVAICLGTTMKKAGSQEAFRKVDHQYVVETARWAFAAKARRLAVVSSVGADVNARNFYLRVKGEMERDVAAIGFDSVNIFRPGVLLGERQESRPMEAVGIAVARSLGGLLRGSMAKYRGILASIVADAMVAALISGEPGSHIRHFEEINALAARL